MKGKLLAILILACLGQAASAFDADSLRVSLVNLYPGKEIYELEGHTVLRISYGGGEAAVSYGTFDFEQPHFVYRFVKGETDYWVSLEDWNYVLRSHMAQGRRVVEHPILLDSVQKAELMRLINVNLLPQNRTYRYNYVKDNCATRPMLMLQLALGDSIILPEPDNGAQADRTFRDVMRRYHRHYPWYQLGIDMALGSGIDYALTPAEKAFAPVVLDSQIDRATVGGRPLTAGAVVLYEGGDATLPPTPWYLTPMAVFLAVLAVTIAVTARDMRRRKVSRWLDAALFGAFGLAGLLLTFLIFVSSHEATSPNWLYMWLNPACLVVPALIWLKKCNKAIFCYQIANFAVLIAMAIAWPISGQSGNAAFVPLIACDAIRAFNYIYVYLKNRNTPSGQ